ncbi:MAG: T9SS type A sorting domain-containing protein [Bacteroidetes bacterium]|nr:T9SS type A sorting domain-containing protein [Bacteroidota bacterium]
MKKIFSLLAAVCITANLFSTNRYWVGATSSWNTASNWSTISGGGGSSGVPGSTDAAIFDGGGTANCSTDANVNVAGINVQSGYSGTITQGAGYTITVGTGNAVFSGGTFSGGNSAITFNGTFTLSGTNFISTSGTITFGNNYTFSSGTFTHNSGLALFKYQLTITGSTTFNNLTFNNQCSCSGNFTLAAGTTLTVDSKLTISGSNIWQLFGGTIDVKGDIDLLNTLSAGSGSSTIINIIGTGNQIMTGQSTGPKCALPPVNVNKASGTLYLNNTVTTCGVWTNTAGTVDAATYGATLYFNLQRASHTVTGSMTLNHVIVSNTSTITRTLTLSAGTTLTVNGTFTLSGDHAIVLSGGNIDAYGDVTVTNTGGSGGGGSNVLTIKGNANQAFTGSGIAGTGRLPNVVIDKNGNTLILLSIISVDRGWTYTAGTVNPGTSVVAFTGSYNTDGENATPTIMSFYDVYVFSGTRTLTGAFDVDHDLTVYSGATLEQNSTTPRAIYIGRNWDDNGAYNTRGAEVTFNGSGAQTLTKLPSGAETFEKVVINKSSNQVNLSAPIVINNYLTLTSGNISSSTTNYVKLIDNAIITVGSGSASSFVDGYVRKVGNDIFTFPMGKGTSNYHPVSISAPCSTNAEFSAQYFNSNQGYGSTLDASITNLSNCEYWIVDREVGSCNVYVTLEWNANSCLISSPIQNMQVARWNSGTSQWDNHGSSNTTGNTTNGTVTTCTAVSTFSPFTLAQCNANCTSASPAVSASPSTICSGQSSTLCASGGSSYSWNTGATTSCITVSPTTTTTYSVTVSDGCLFSTTLTVTVTYNSASPPTANAGSDVQVEDPATCQGAQPVQIGSAQVGSNTYLWTASDPTALNYLNPGATDPDPFLSYYNPGPYGTYNVTMTVTVTDPSTGCLNWDDLAVTFAACRMGHWDTTTSVSNAIENKIEIFPNPAADFINIIVQIGEKESASVEFYDMIGNKILPVQLFHDSDSKTISFTEINKGIYFYKIKINGENYKTGKLVIAR